LLVVIAITFGLGLAASGYLNYVQFSRANDNEVALNGQLTDLRYQLKQDKLAPSPTASPSASPTPSATPSVLGTTAVNFVQLGVAVSATDPIADLTYSYQLVSGLAVANLTTTGLVAQYPTCKPGTALGQLVRRPKTSRAAATSKLIKSFGDYNYYYVAPAGNCATDAAGRATVVAAKAALTDAILPTLIQIQ
jgi:hypothetical protein